MRVAAIDCGTNSIRLLIADVNDGVLVELVRKMIIVRLGEGVDRTGEFSSAALERTFAACDEYAQIISEYQPSRIRFVATSASRDAKNRDDFYRGVQSRLGVLPDVISGDEEARLSFLGATSGITSLANAPDGPFLVIDIGGGSTEFVFGSDAPNAALSTNVGCVRMTERHLKADPPTAESIEAATQDIDEAISLAAQTVPITSPSTLVGVAGSVTTIAALSLNLTQYDSSKIHGSCISGDEVHRITQELLAMPRSQRAALAPMHEGRVDVIGGGALVLDRIMRFTGHQEIWVSETDILDGIALNLAK